MSVAKTYKLHVHVLIFIAIEAAVKKWEELKAQGKLPQLPKEEDIYAHAKIGGEGEEFDSDEGGMDVEWEEGGEESHVAQVTVPSQQEIEEMLVRRRKKV